MLVTIIIFSFVTPTCFSGALLSYLLTSHWTIVVMWQSHSQLCHPHPHILPQNEPKRRRYTHTSHTHPFQTCTPQLAPCTATKTEPCVPTFWVLLMQSIRRRTVHDCGYFFIFLILSFSLRRRNGVSTTTETMGYHWVNWGRQNRRHCNSVMELSFQ